MLISTLEWAGGSIRSALLFPHEEVAMASRFLFSYFVSIISRELHIY